MTKPYRPSNGTEGEFFREKFCYQCAKDNYPDGPFCKIIRKTIIYRADDPNYPREWVYDPNRHPTCTAFEKK